MSVASRAKAKYIRCSQYKLRPIADVVRGKSVDYALGWLSAYPSRRAELVRKVIESAFANAKQLSDYNAEALFVSDIRIDGGPIVKYSKCGARGRAMPQRRRLCHISVSLSD